MARNMGKNSMHKIDRTFLIDQMFQSVDFYHLSVKSIKFYNRSVKSIEL